MAQESSLPRPELWGPHTGTAERTIAAPPSKIYAAWTTDAIGSWAASPGHILIRPEVDVPYFFETHFAGQRHAHHGRFLTLDPDRLIEMTWQNAGGTEGVETVVKVELIETDGGTHVKLTHSGFTDEGRANGHSEAWAAGLEDLASVVES